MMVWLDCGVSNSPCAFGCCCSFASLTSFLCVGLITAPGWCFVFACFGLLELSRVGLTRPALWCCYRTSTVLIILTTVHLQATNLFTYTNSTQAQLFLVHQAATHKHTRQHATYNSKCHTNTGYYYIIVAHLHWCWMQFWFNKVSHAIRIPSWGNHFVEQVCPFGTCRQLFSIWDGIRNASQDSMDADSLEKYLSSRSIFIIKMSLTCPHY